MKKIILLLIISLISGLIYAGSITFLYGTEEIILNTTKPNDSLTLKTKDEKELNHYSVSKQWRHGNAELISAQ